MTISPILLYTACAIGALGVLLALPKRRAAAASPSGSAAHGNLRGPDSAATPAGGLNAFAIGGLIAAIALGLALVGLGLGAAKSGGGGEGGLPNFHFYIFSAIALFGALRVISHPRPVYAALYFILTILASCGLYLLLAAEFMAFALVIVYAGAILITYLFVIMLATEAPSNETIDMLRGYDRYSREPVFATVAGFVLLAALSTSLARGSASISPAPTLVRGPDAASPVRSDANLAIMSRKVDRLLATASHVVVEERVVPDDSGGTRVERAKVIQPLLKPGERLAKREDAGAAIFPQADGNGYLVVVDEAGVRRQIPQSAWPRGLQVDNTEGVAFAFIGGKPGAIEIAGIILLMAMLAAVVLARKKVDHDEAARHALLDRHLVEPRLAPAPAGPRAPRAAPEGVS
ncbi:MAG: NADH-quinone oxidoreductase subunit J [Phycisphaerales bacterium]